MPGHRQGPDPRRRTHARPQRRLRGPRRCRRHVGTGQPSGDVLDAADHARLHRACRAAGRPRAPRWPLRCQLRQLRGRRRPRIAFSQDHDVGQGARRGGRRPDHRRRGPGSHRRDQGRHRQASDRGHQGKLGTRRVRHHRRRLDLPHLHRSGRGATRRHRDHRSHPSAQGCVPGTALHPGYLEHFVRFEPGRTAGPQLGVPARVHRGRSGHGDCSRVQDFADGANSGRAA
ncbi:hypothetical protein B0E55_06394 [Rhodococcus sp. 66b]|nr:hypothetical protein B0E55_06394 [Rhodococcus sp. 66b]